MVFFSRTRAPVGGALEAGYSPPVLESVIGSDDRDVVIAVEDWPWRPLVALDITYADGSTAVGTGVLIGQQWILTAAHNLYALDLGKLARNVTARVGVAGRDSKATESVVWAGVDPRYPNIQRSDPARYHVDYGLARLSSTRLHDWSGDVFDIHRMTPLSDAELRRSLLNIAGYPDPERKGARSLVLKTGNGQPLQDLLSPTRFAYQIDTEIGQSGAPVFRYDASSKSVVIAGIHVGGFGSRHFNLACRFSADMKRQVRHWMDSQGG